jgi:hypothetical protein
MMDLTALHQTLTQRRRPEDVAELLVPLLQHKLTLEEQKTLAKAAAGSLRRSAWQFSSMLAEFAPPVGAEKQARKAAELLGHALPETVGTPAGPDYADPEQVAQLLRELNPRLAKAVGRHDYQADRLNRAARQAAGLGELSRRRYNKQFRALRHLEAKLQRLLAGYRQRELHMTSKSGFAHELPYAEFATDLFSAAFIAYFTARSNLRSEFTIAGQQRAYDEVADMLFRRCREGQPRPFAWRNLLTAAPPVAPPATTNWWAVAQVFPAPDVLEQLTDNQKGQLLGRWTALLLELAGQLHHIWAANTFRRVSMVVKKGDDSSTWNIAAGAWNKARDNWISLLYALGMELVLEDKCPGKVLRLMAADVVHWHQQTGGQLDPNTAVWAALPLPWEVLTDAAPCTRSMIEAACQQVQLDPVKSGWLAPREHAVVAFRPTPELVHGVSISSPYLANLLRRNKFYSGKPAVQ